MGRYCLVQYDVGLFRLDTETGDVWQFRNGGWVTVAEPPGGAAEEALKRGKEGRRQEGLLARWERAGSWGPGEPGYQASTAITT